MTYRSGGGGGAIGFGAGGGVAGGVGFSTGNGTGRGATTFGAGALGASNIGSVGLVGGTAGLVVLAVERVLAGAGLARGSADFPSPKIRFKKLGFADSILLPAPRGLGFSSARSWNRFTSRNTGEGVSVFAGSGFGGSDLATVAIGAGIS